MPPFPLYVQQPSNLLVSPGRVKMPSFLAGPPAILSLPQTITVLILGYYLEQQVQNKPKTLQDS